MNGFIIVDKPEGMSSAQVVGFVKRRLGADRIRKIGHTGTLDPFATGVLVLCLNRATRLSHFFLHGDKEYRAVIRLGIETDTLDSTGTVVQETPVPAYTAASISQALQAFSGDITQVPPAYSALKQNGVPLYQLARAGKPVTKPPRPVTIHRIELNRVALPDIAITVTCSGGTYIRTLAQDIGRKLGCGAHLSRLTRSASGHMRIENALSIKTLRNWGVQTDISAHLISMNDALPDLPSLMVDKPLTQQINHGRIVRFSDFTLPAAPLSGGWGRYLKLVDVNGNLKAIVEPDDEKAVFNYMCVFPD